MPDRMIVDDRADRPVFGAMFSIEAIKAASRDVGSHYFDADTMRFFRSRVLPPVYFGRFFVTSEATGFGASTRRYNVREFMPDATIETVGEFNAYATPAQARAAIRRLSREQHTYYFDVTHGKAGRRRTYVITAHDPWEAMDRLHSNARIHHCGRAADWMTDGNGYVIVGAA